ncbi:MAG: preprotein translocase subunit YajC [bacterium]|nr:preprotein translocase subunit YajC [bacterium]
MEILANLATAAAKSGGLQGMLVSFGPFILIIIVMYFLLFRSQQKKAKKRQAMLNEIKTGDKVVTTGGLIGTVSTIKDKTALVKIADNVKVEISRGSISGVIEKNAN